VLTLGHSSSTEKKMLICAPPLPTASVAAIAPATAAANFQPPQPAKVMFYFVITNKKRIFVAEKIFTSKTP
jgi:hypothetical protein